MKTLKKYLLGAALISVAALTGCKDKMVELNTDPAISTSADLKEAFYGATRYYLYQGGDTQGNRAATVGQVMQYYVSSGGTSIFSHELDNMTNPWPVSNHWSNHLYGSATFGPLISNLIKTIDAEYADDLGQAAYGEIRAISKLVLIYQLWMNLDVMGTIVYTEGFKNDEGITRPVYDLYEDVYKDMIDVVKTEVIDVLKQPAAATRISLGKYDSFFGYKLIVTPGQRGSVAEERNDADEQRDLWLRFANTFRLRMGHRVWNVDEPTFTTVLADYMTAAAANQVMTGNEHNCYMIYGWEDEVYNNMGGDFIRQTQRAPLAFVNTLRVLDDPRLHYLVRTNFMDTTFQAKYSKDFDGQLVNTFTTINTYDYAPDFAFMLKHFPDSLARFGKMMEIGNTYQGVSASPYAFSKTNNAIYSTLNGGKVPTESYYTFTINNPTPDANYVSPHANNWDGEVSIAADQQSIQKRIYMASLMQIRYFMRIGGNIAHYLDVPQPRKADGSIDEPVRRQVRSTTTLLSYTEHCFRMSMITLDGFSTGKSAQEWFEDGIRSNMEQLNEDVLRLWVPIAWSTDYALVRYYRFDPMTQTYETTLTNVNGSIAGDGTITITPYSISTAAIDNYIQNTIGTVDKEKLGIQAWIGLYQQPEEAWAFRKQLGYPRMLEIEPFSSVSKDVALPTTPGMEKTYSVNSQVLQVQRRATPPEPNVENNANYSAMRTAIESAAWFGGSSYLDRTGRVWWDQNNLPYVVD